MVQTIKRVCCFNLIHSKQKLMELEQEQRQEYRPQWGSLNLWLYSQPCFLEHHGQWVRVTFYWVLSWVMISNMQNILWLMVSYYYAVYVLWFIWCYLDAFWGNAEWGEPMTERQAESWWISEPVHGQGGKKIWQSSYCELCWDKDVRWWNPAWPFGHVFEMSVFVALMIILIWSKCVILVKQKAHNGENEYLDIWNIS